MSSNLASFRFDSAILQDPHPSYARLRAELPVHQSVMPSGLKVWVLTRYQDVRSALSDPRLSTDVERARELMQKYTNLEPSAQMLSKHMLNADPPDHTRLRKLVATAFTARRVDALKPRVEQLTHELLDDLPIDTDVDLVSQFGMPLPLAVICELFGVPQPDQADFSRLAMELITDSASMAMTSRSMDQKEAAAAISSYLSQLVERRRREPGSDLLSGLVQARGDDGQDVLNHSEIVSAAFLTLSAGHETVVNLIGNGMLALLSHPDQLESLRADPSLLPSAIEELLRFDGPANSAWIRHTTEPVTFGDVTVPAGQFVLAIITSANRDNTRFPDADRLDITRGSRGHLTFGHGIHHCLGAALARCEAESAFRILLERFPNIRLAADPHMPRWRFSTLIRGLESLPVRLGEPSRAKH
jgi:cytochrome P450